MTCRRVRRAVAVPCRTRKGRDPSIPALPAPRNQGEVVDTAAASLPDPSERWVAPHRPCDHRHHEQDEEDHEKHLRDARRGACDTAEAECRRDQRDDEERNSPTEHGLSPSLWTLSLCAGLTPAAGTWFPALERAVRDPAHRSRIRRARPDCARGGNWRETG